MMGLLNKRLSLKRRQGNKLCDNYEWSMKRIESKITRMIRVMEMRMQSRHVDMNNTYEGL